MSGAGVMNGRYWPNTEASRPTKEEAPCCVARALPDGRLPIGFCSPECVRRPRG